MCCVCVSNTVIIIYWPDSTLITFIYGTCFIIHPLLIFSVSLSSHSGTYSKRSRVLNGRRPFQMDHELFNYDYDSEAEWEEGDGEGNSSSI